MNNIYIMNTVDIAVPSGIDITLLPSMFIANIHICL